MMTSRRKTRERAIMVKEYTKERLLSGIEPFSEVPFSFLDNLLDTKPEDFDRRVGDLVTELDELGIRIMPDKKLGKKYRTMISPALEKDPYAREILALPRFSREDEYRMAKRYALVKERFIRTLRKAGIEMKKDCLNFEPFLCPEGVSPGTKKPLTCEKILKTVSEDDAKIIRERCREFNMTRNAFIEGCLYIVLLVLARFRFSGISREDLIQEGNASLFRAVDRYDWKKGVRFRTYAEYWIHQSFLEAVYNHSRTVRIPAWIQKATKRIQKAVMMGHGKEPGEKVAGIGIEKAESILRENRKTISLDMPTIEGEALTLMESMAGDGDASDEASEREISKLLPQRINTLLLTLPPRERYVLELRFGLSGMKVHTLGEVGRKLGISAERVRQIQENALRRLKEPGRRKFLEGLA